MDQITARSIFDYQDGHLVWKVKTCAKVVVGRRAGRDRGDRYWQATHRGTVHYVHRIVWIWHNGEIPADRVIDHIDRDPSNNRIENLRLLPHARNVAHQGLRSDSTSGVRGVYPLGPEYRAAYRAQFRGRHLGCFHTLDAAKRAFEKASRSFVEGGM